LDCCSSCDIRDPNNLIDEETSALEQEERAQLVEHEETLDSGFFCMMTLKIQLGQRCRDMQN
jgi:hypothetical protein